MAKTATIEKLKDRFICPYAPFSWQLDALRDLSPIVLLTGSAGGGKSRCAAEKAHAFCLRYPGAMILVLRKDRAVMTNSSVLFLQETVIGRDPKVKHMPSKSRFEYWNGSILAYGGMFDTAQREKMRSIGMAGGLDFVWMEEATAFSEGDFNEVLRGMRGTAAPWRQIILTTNPDAPTHWIYKRLITGGESKTYYSSAADNPTNPDDYRETLGRMTGVQRQRLVEGRWIHAEGAVYDEFDAGVHVVDQTIPKEWRRIISVDFGYTNPFTAQWWAIDHDGRMYLYRELYKTGRIVADHAREIDALSAAENIEAVVCDHDAEDRAQFEKVTGWRTKLARKDVSLGIQTVKDRLRKAGDGRPRLFILRDTLHERDERLAAEGKPCCTLDEIAGYQWQKDQTGRPRKEEPRKENDHGMDAMRYTVMHLDRPGRKTFKRRWEHARV